MPDPRGLRAGLSVGIPLLAGAAAGAAELGRAGVDGRVPGLKLLKALAGGDCSMREISQALHVSPRTITDMIDNLEARGLVSRCPHPSDRRITRLRLTETGTRELASASASAESERLAARAVSDLDQREQDLLRTLLARVCVPAGTATRGLNAP